jgi:hypothetical protein
MDLSESVVLMRRFETFSKEDELLWSVHTMAAWYVNMPREKLSWPWPMPNGLRVPLKPLLCCARPGLKLQPLPLYGAFAVARLASQLGVARSARH